MSDSPRARAARRPRPGESRAPARDAPGREGRHRLLITVCPREPGTITIPVERGGRRRRLDAAAIARVLGEMVTARGLGDAVRVREGCAGGCYGRGPNVGVTVYPPLRPGEPPDTVAVAWRTYVGSLGSLGCLADAIDENLCGARGRPSAPGTRRRSHAMPRSPVE